MVHEKSPFLANQIWCFTRQIFQAVQALKEVLTCQYLKQISLSFGVSIYMFVVSTKSWRFWKFECHLTLCSDIYLLKYLMLFLHYLYTILYCIQCKNNLSIDLFCCLFLMVYSIYSSMYTYSVLWYTDYNILYKCRY